MEIRFRDAMTVELVKHAASDADVIWAARVSTKGESSLADVEAGTPEQHMLVTEATRESYRQAYAAFLEMLDAGVAREVARTVLPVGLYTSMYATCNARALMIFLSLRTRRDDASFPSFPQRVI